MDGSFFIHFMVTTIASSSAILLILMVKKALKKHITMRWQYNLDLLFLLLLAVPFIPGKIFKLFNAGKWLHTLGFGSNTTADTAVSDGMEAMYGTGWLQDFSISVNRSAPEYLPAIFMGIWIVGIVVFAVITIFGNRNLRLIKESMKPVEDTEILSLFARCKTERGIKRNVLFGVSVLVKTPLTIGIFKTRIILPADKIAVSDIRYVLLHELTHCKHRDITVNGIMCLFQILYWFNPLVYLVFKEMRLDREIACDTSVLKLLPEEFHVDYGKTLLNFVKTMPRPSVLSFSTDMGGSKPQIIKRITHIASYKTESRLLKAKSVCVFAVAGLLIISQIPTVSVLAAYDDGKANFKADNIAYEDLTSFFEGFEGSFVLYDLLADSYTIHNGDMSVTRVSPASTYKIYSGLIALETGVIDTAYSVREWNGMTYPYESWNEDQTLISAMQNSVSWYFQDTDTQVGIKELDSYFTRLSYGNHDLSGGVSNYWMESSLRISPVEQVALLKNFYQNNTIFQAGNVDTMKDILRLSEKDGAVLSGKTGTGSVNGKVINGWFIGYVEKGGRTFIFAANIQGEDNAGGSTAVQITLSILKDKGIY